MKTVYDHIAYNNVKIFLLTLLFPLTLCLLFWAMIQLVFMGDEEGLAEGMAFFRTWMPFVIGGAMVWMGISLFFGDDIMLSLARAKPISQTSQLDEKKIFNAVENTAIRAGLPTPKVFIIEDDSLNAFATGYSPRTASVALTRGIVKKLTPLELEAVIGHEMAHIGNRDVRLNTLIITGLSVLGILGDVFIRMNSSNRNSKNNSGGLLILLGFTLIIFNALIAPLIQLAISRTMEYNADATSALITRDPESLISALKKISADPRVEVLDEYKQMAVACISDPGKKSMSFFDDMFSTHPTTRKRIERLRAMSGK